MTITNIIYTIYPTILPLHQTEDLEHDSTRSHSSAVAMTEMQEQSGDSRYRITHIMSSEEITEVGITVHFPMMDTTLVISFSSTIDDIRGRVQDLVERINVSRSNDQNMIANFQEEIVDKV